MTRIKSTASIRAQRARSRSRASPARKHARRPHKVIFETITQEKRRLRTVVSCDLIAPAGYTFIAAGHPRLTQACKERSRQGGHKVYVVSSTPRKSNHLSEHVHRIGYHFASAVVHQVSQELDLYITHAGRVRTEPAVSWGGQSDGPDETGPLSQEELNAQAQAALVDLFPAIPALAVQQIIHRAFKMGKNKVGTAIELPLARRVQLAVVAHIRHHHTDYERLLGTCSQPEARARVQAACRNKLQEWRGDEAGDGTGPIEFEHLMREVIVISDDDEDLDDEESDHDADKEGDKKHQRSVDHHASRVEVIPSDPIVRELDMGESPVEHGAPGARDEDHNMDRPYVVDAAAVGGRRYAVHLGRSRRRKKGKDRRRRRGFGRYDAVGPLSAPATIPSLVLDGLGMTSSSQPGSAAMSDRGRAANNPPSSLIPAPHLLQSLSIGANKLAMPPPPPLLAPARPVLAAAEGLHLTIEAHGSGPAIARPSVGDTRRAQEPPVTVAYQGHHEPVSVHYLANRGSHRDPPRQVVERPPRAETASSMSYLNHVDHQIRHIHPGITSDLMGFSGPASRAMPFPPSQPSGLFCTVGDRRPQVTDPRQSQMIEVREDRAAIDLSPEGTSRPREGHYVHPNSMRISPPPSRFTDGNAEGYGTRLERPSQSYERALYFDGRVWLPCREPPRPVCVLVEQSGGPPRPITNHPPRHDAVHFLPDLRNHDESPPLKSRPFETVVGGAHTLHHAGTRDIDGRHDHVEHSRRPMSPSTSRFLRPLVSEETHDSSRGEDHHLLISSSLAPPRHHHHHHHHHHLPPYPQEDVSSSFSPLRRSSDARRVSLIPVVEPTRPVESEHQAIMLVERGQPSEDSAEGFPGRFVVSPARDRRTVMVPVRDVPILSHERRLEYHVSEPVQARRDGQDLTPGYIRSTPALSEQVILLANPETDMRPTSIDGHIWIQRSSHPGNSIRDVPNQAIELRYSSRHYRPDPRDPRYMHYLSAPPSREGPPRPPMHETLGRRPASPIVIPE